MISLTLDEGLSLTLLQLLHSALSGLHPTEKKQEEQSKSSTKSKDKEKKKTEQDQVVSTAVSTTAAANFELNKSLCQLLLESVTDDSLKKFLNRFLLQSNQTTIRWQTHSFVYCLYKYVIR